jgi:hypothetical protein
MGVIVAPQRGAAAWVVRPEETGALRAARQALAAATAGAGRVALRVPGPAAPHRRRAVRIVLQDAARAEAARVLEAPAPTGDLLLLGATAEGAARAEAMLAASLATPDPEGPAPPETWRLPEHASALLAWAEAADRPPSRDAATGEAAVPGLAGLDAVLDALSPDGPGAAAIRVRRAVIRLAPGRAPVLAWHRIVLSRQGLAAALGPLGEDPDLLDHAADLLAGRWLRRAPPGPGGAVPVMWPLPQGDDIPDPPGDPGAVAVLPLASAVEAGLAARCARLRAAGWRLAFDGVDAAALRLLAPAALPPDALLLLRWSPALEDERPVQAALRALDPGRLVLTGCDGPQALAFGIARGIAHLDGPAIEALRSAPAGTAP